MAVVAFKSDVIRLRAKPLFLAGVLSFFVLSCKSERQKFLGNVHTAAAFIPPLVEMENKIVERLKKVVDEEGVIDDEVIRYITEWESSVSDDFASNPLNSYYFFKRLVYDYQTVEGIVTSHNSSSAIAIQEVRKLKALLEQPSEEDIKGATWAITRLQEVYDLPIEDLVNGSVKGSKAIKGLDANDCLKLSQHSFENLAFDVSELWTKKAVEILRKTRPFKKEHEGKIKESLALLKKRTVMRELVTAMAKKEGEDLKGKFAGLGIPKSFEKEVYKSKDKSGQVDLIEKVFKGLCSEKKLQLVGELPQPMRHCSLSFGKPQMRHYAPFRIEQILSSPDIRIFHDVISENEIQQLQMLAYPHLENARVKPYTNDVVMKSIARIGKSAWLKRTNYSLVDSIMHRIESMTGLTTRFAKELHILNYGIGGHYELHVDFFDYQNRAKTDNESALKGDQLLTVLFYLNDVEAGGSTVFPFINVGVKPTKGSALVWRNLYKNGSGNYNTLHASCPILLGQKWITTLWLNEYGQEFRAPCSLNPEE